MMRALSGTAALLQLIARPATLWLLGFLAWAVAFPLARAMDGDSMAAGSSAAAEATWQGIVLVSAVLGLVLSLSRLELQHTLFSWTVPGLRARLHAGTVTLALTIALVAVTVASMAVQPAVGVGAMAFGLSLLTMALVAMMVDAAMSRTARWRAGLAILVMAVRPDWTSWLGTRAGLPLGVAFAALALLLWRRQYSTDAARRRPFLFSGLVAAPSGYAIRHFWSRRASDREWRGPLTTTRVAPWLRAAAYEGFAWRGPSYIGSRAMMAVIAVTFAHFAGNPAMLMLLGIALGTKPLQLARAPRYPLARRDRARIAFAGTVVDAAVAASLCAALMPVLTLLPVPAFFLPHEPGSQRTWWIAVGALFALAPVAQWSAARGHALADAVGGRVFNSVRGFLPWFAFVFALVLVVGLLSRVHDAVFVAAVLVAITIAAYLVHFVTLRTYYARASLV